MWVAIAADHTDSKRDAVAAVRVGIEAVFAAVVVVAERLASHLLLDGHNVQRDPSVATAAAAVLRPVQKRTNTGRSEPV